MPDQPESTKEIWEGVKIKLQALISTGLHSSSQEFHDEWKLLKPRWDAAKDSEDEQAKREVLIDMDRMCDDELIRKDEAAP